MKFKSVEGRTKRTKGQKAWRDEEMGRRPSGKTPEQKREELRCYNREYMRRYREAHRDELNAKRRELRKRNQQTEVNLNESKQKSSEIDRNTPEIDQAADKSAGGTD